MKALKLFVIMLVLVVISACITQPSTYKSTSPSTSSTFPSRVRDVTPPVVLNFTWIPERVVWDKVYDIRVSFRVVDGESGVKSVVLKFVPVEYKYFITKYGMRPEDYPKVFPPDKERVYKLKPLDGKFDEQKEEFSVDIKNITGGREYRILIIAKDQENNTAIFEYKTPYIRQYENFGKQLYEKGIIVSVSYMSSYQPFIFGKKMDDYPLLGRYTMPPIDEIDEIVLDKHVDWAGYAGINVFFIDAGAWEDWKINGDEGKVMKRLMDKGVKCAFMWYAWTVDERFFVKGTAKNAPDWSIDLSYQKNRDSFLEQLITILNSSLVKHPNYFRMNGRPVIFLYDAAVFVNETEAWEILKKSIKEDPYILADVIHAVENPEKVDKHFYSIWKDLKQYDAISSWVGFVGNPMAFKNNSTYLKDPNSWFYIMNQEWSNFAKEKRLEYVASVFPGFKYYYDKVGIPRNVEEFQDRIVNSLKYTKFIRIDTWNDFAENTFIEPSVGEGFVYLDVLRKVLEEYSK